MSKRKNKSKRKNPQIAGNNPSVEGDPSQAHNGVRAKGAIDPIKALVFGLIVGAAAVVISLA